MTKAKAKTKAQQLTEKAIADSSAPIEPVKSGRAGAKVTVACKLPSGLHLRLFEMTDTRENVSGNSSRMVKEARQVGEIVTIRGVSTPFGVQKPLVGGYALTPNVDKEFFDEWMRQNAETAVVKNGMIFAHETRDGVEGMAKDRKDLKSGVEPLDMSMVKRGERKVAADARVPRTNNPNLSDIEKADAAA